MEQPPGVRVSHETIYTAIDALPRGELRRELISYLRQDKPTRGRKPKGSERRGKLCNMTNIKERPEEIEGRLVPGYWEGDFILGAGGASAIGTLVERTTRFVVLVHMPTREADVAACAFTGALNAIPAPLRKTLTYDQGKEMAQHERLAVTTGMRIFFADPHAPWQRGSNENTNGLLRSVFPQKACPCRPSARPTSTPSPPASTTAPEKRSTSPRQASNSPACSPRYRGRETRRPPAFAPKLESANRFTYFFSPNIR